jgi:hypothetical protein
MESHPATTNLREQQFKLAGSKIHAQKKNQLR